MYNRYRDEDYKWIRELMTYPETLEKNLSYFENTSQVAIPDDPIEKVIFQDRAKKAIRKVAQNKGHLLLAGKPGTGKSMLADMFNHVIDKSLGDYIRHKESIVAYPGKDQNNMRVAYADPGKIEEYINMTNHAIEHAKESIEEFSLDKQIHSVRKVKTALLWITGLSIITGVFFPPAFIVTGLSGIGAIFMFMQENNHKVQEKIQRETQNTKSANVKQLMDLVPEILHDPRKDANLMIRVSEPNSSNMKGGFRHDPYQSGNLQTPIQKRAYLGAHAKAPSIYIDELKTLIKEGYMSSLLEIMQNKKYILEGGRNTGSGAADRSENYLKADNIIIACCNHDTLQYLQRGGDGAFLSRIEDKGEIIHMESSVPETKANIAQVAQYIKQEVNSLAGEFKDTWGVMEKEGHSGVRKRCEQIFGKRLPLDYRLKVREFSRNAVAEIIKELRCRASDRKLSCILRPVNGIIRTAEIEAIIENSELVEPRHIRNALKEHTSMEGAYIPWQNKHDIEPLLVNADFEYIQKEEVPGIKIYRTEGKMDPFNIYFCKTKYNAYRILMGVSRKEVEDRITEISKQDIEFMRNTTKT